MLSRFLKHLISVACNFLRDRYGSVIDEGRCRFFTIPDSLSCRLAKYPGLVWTETAPNLENVVPHSNILLERLAERAWYTKSQSSLLNIYFHISGFSSSFLLIYLLSGLSKTMEPKPFRYATIQFQDRRGAASLLYRNQACRNCRSYVWTNTLSDVVFVPARELSSSRHSLNFLLGRGNALILFYSPEKIMKSNLVCSCYFSDECCQSFLSPVARNPHTLLAFRAHSQITVPALAFTRETREAYRGRRTQAGGAS